MYVYTRVCVYIYMHTYIHTYIYTHVYKDTHTGMQNGTLFDHKKVRNPIGCNNVDESGINYVK